jgi:hypothetical protein
VLPVRLGEEYAAEGIVASLRDRGVEVELRNESWETRLGASSVEKGILPTITPVAAAENELNYNQGGAESSSDLSSMNLLQQGQEVDPIRLFVEFLGSPLAEKSLSASVIPESLATASKKAEINSKTETLAEDENKLQRLRLDLHQSVLCEGADTLQRLLSSTNVSSSSAGSHSSPAISTRAYGRSFDLRMEQVSLTNFGPFGGGPLRYPLSNRGLVLLRGQGQAASTAAEGTNGGEDDALSGLGADSNGAGKTSLAMSIMWALTGSMDPRLVTDGRAVDVAHDPPPSRMTTTSSRSNSSSSSSSSSSSTNG